jgi:hypothetical protein
MTDIPDKARATDPRDHGIRQTPDPDARGLDAQLRLYRTQARWEPWKALAAIFGAAAIFAGSVLALSNWISRQQQTINVHLDAPLTITPK